MDLTNSLGGIDKADTRHGELRRLPGESIAAWQALIAYAGMVSSAYPRPFPALAQQFGVHVKTVYRWSSQHHWRDRLAEATKAFYASTLQTAAISGIPAANDWAGHRQQLRETEWNIHLDLINAALHALDQWRASGQLLRPGDIARLIELASKIGRLAAGLPLEPTPVTGSEARPIQIDIETALEKVYGTPKPAEVTDSPDEPHPPCPPS